MMCITAMLVFGGNGNELQCDLLKCSELALKPADGAFLGGCYIVLVVVSGL